jgi:para-aminobenzoate synthetase component I
MDRVFKIFDVESTGFDATLALRHAHEHFREICLLNSNGYRNDRYGTYGQLLALGAAQTINTESPDAFSDLKNLADQTNDWLFGYLSYDLKNQLEDLQSANHDGLHFPVVHFFRPVVVAIVDGGRLNIGCLPGFGDASNPDWIFELLTRMQPATPLPSRPVKPLARVDRKRYLKQVRAIQENIRFGDIYEMNYCVEFFDDTAQIDPYRTYAKLNQLSPTPFSAFYRAVDHYLLCASPERFIKKQGDQLISQPIKGTRPRGQQPEEDAMLRDALYNDTKERSENVMIVDLVRNDLSHVATPNSVQVTELFGIYSFSTVHQMISTVTARLRSDRHFTDALRHAFPMGSMTGAPKVRAMQLIEEYEDTRRGLFSGAVGYIAPAGDFDFNVVIRSILYNAHNNYLGFLAGSAITAAAIPELEYEECLLKVRTMIKALD